MMTRRLVLILMLALATSFMAGCRTNPIREVQSAPVPNAPLSTRKVQDAIKAAGAGQGWVMQREAPGLITGTLNVRDHMAQVRIAYDSRTYSIRYKNSSNLKYDAANRTIHSNYNGWIQNLDNAIRVQLALAK